MSPHAFCYTDYGACGAGAVQANWGDVWKLALSVFAQQRIEVQILLGLLAAFLAIMVIEGLRASFFPRRREAASPPAGEAEEKIVFIPQPPPQAMAAAPSQSFAARPIAAPPPSLKRKTASIRRHKPTRPIIRRMTSRPDA
jgi:hypothetical protein